MNDWDHYQRAIDRGIAWLLEQQNADGSMDPVEGGIGGYYKVPYAFSLTGNVPAGVRLLDWVRENNFAADGDFKGRSPRLGPHGIYYHYANSWMVCGAERLGQFDISRPAGQFVMSLQDDSGGFPTAGPEAKPGDPIDLMSTPIAGLACLWVGATEAAQRAGDLLVQMLDEQPMPEERLYFIRDANGLVVDYPPEEATQHVVDVTGEKQWYFITGACAALLVRLCRATSGSRYLRAAQQYIEFCTRCGPDRYSTPQSGKAGWGSALLYGLTGDEQYATIARTVGDYLVESQQEDGTWRNPAVSEEAYVVMDATAEFVVELCEIIEGLAMGDRA
jgi:hypothetical protein